MTYHESYGSLRKDTLSVIRKSNVSPADYDDVLSAFGWDWTSADINWDAVNDFITANTHNGNFRRMLY
jgi:hypothetical protein